MSAVREAQDYLMQKGRPVLNNIGRGCMRSDKLRRACHCCGMSPSNSPMKSYLKAPLLLPSFWPWLRLRSRLSRRASRPLQNLKIERERK
jgi:hypothetical protein